MFADVSKECAASFPQEVIFTVASMKMSNLTTSEFPHLEDACSR
jgi:hypothetical protein